MRKTLGNTGLKFCFYYLIFDFVKPKLFEVVYSPKKLGIIICLYHKSLGKLGNAEVLFFFFERFYLFIFREGSEREKHHVVTASQAPPTGDLAHNPDMCPDWESNWRPFGSQSSAQSTEPHQTGQNVEVLCKLMYTTICLLLQVFIKFKEVSNRINFP